MGIRNEHQKWVSEMNIRMNIRSEHQMGIRNGHQKWALEKGIAYTYQKWV